MNEMQQIQPNGDWSRLLNNKVVFLTGGGGTIGTSIAHTCYLHGARVAIADINVNTARYTLERIASTDQTHLLAISLDVTNEKSIQEAVDLVVSKWNTVDILINCAAVFTLGSVENVTSEDWDRVFAVNVKGCALMVKAVVPLFKKHKSGSIINIASSLGLVAMNDIAPYSTSKGAIIQLTKNLALDLGPYNIRVNSISPGPVDTPILAEMEKALNIPKLFWNAAVNGKCIKRLANKQEIANMIVFLASDLCTFCTGANFIVDGGHTAV